MADNAASFTGSIPQYYDQGLGPVIERWDAGAHAILNAGRECHP